MPMLTRKHWTAVLISVLFLPASCASGVVANGMQSVRLGTSAGEGGPLWLENLLWLGALVLMILWARQIKCVFKSGDAPANAQP